MERVHVITVGMDIVRITNNQCTLQIEQKRPFSAMSTEVNLLHGVNGIMFVLFQHILINNNQPYPMVPQSK